MVVGGGGSGVGGGVGEGGEGGGGGGGLGGGRRRVTRDLHHVRCLYPEAQPGESAIIPPNLASAARAANAVAGWW